MTAPADRSLWRLANLPTPAKLMVTLFLALVGCGYLVAVANIYEKHHDADLEPGMSLDDLRRVYHGLDKEVTSETRLVRDSKMMKAVKPGGVMRDHLEEGGEPALRTLIGWLKDGARETDFARPGLYNPADPSPRQVITAQCVRCHNPVDGENPDLPYAPGPSALAEYDLVASVARPLLGATTQETRTLHLAPMDRAELVHVTHVHILSIPVFTLIVGSLFLLTGLRRGVKLILGPLPMLAVCCDLSSWWLARVCEPFVYVIAAAGAVFAATYGPQILLVVLSMWFGRRTPG
jgi:hypothetical protein